MIQKLLDIFKRGDSFSPLGQRLDWFRIRYDDAEKIMSALTKLSIHTPIAIRWRANGVEERFFIGIKADVAATLQKMGKELKFSVDEAINIPDPITDRFSPSQSLFIEFDSTPSKVGASQYDAPAGEESDEFEVISEPSTTKSDLNVSQGTKNREGDGWIYKGALFAHDERGQNKKLLVPQNSAEWKLPAPFLGTWINPEWPRDLVTDSRMVWQEDEWVIGRTDKHEPIGSQVVQVFGETEYNHLWLAGLIAAREKQGIPTLVIDGKGDFLEYLYTEGSAFGGIPKMDVDGKTRIEINPLIPVIDENGKRNIEETAQKWLVWFRSIDVPSTVEYLITKAAASPAVISLDSLLNWLSGQSGEDYAKATNFKNFILPWQADKVNWLMGTENHAIETLSVGSSLWIKCPYDHFKSRRGIYISVLMQAAEIPHLSIVLVHVPIDPESVPGLAAKKLVICNDQQVKLKTTMVMTRSNDLDELTGMKMIVGDQVDGVQEYIRQLNRYEAIVAKPNPDYETTGGQQFFVARVGWI